MGISTSTKNSNGITIIYNGTMYVYDTRLNLCPSGAVGTAAFDSKRFLIVRRSFRFCFRVSKQPRFYNHRNTLVSSYVRIKSLSTVFDIPSNR